MKIKVVQKIIAVMCAASISGSCVVTTVGALDDRELVAVAQGGSATNEDLAEAQVLQEEYDVKQAIKASEEEYKEQQELKKARELSEEEYKKQEKRKLVAAAQGGPATDEDVAKAQVLQEEYDVKQAIKASAKEYAEQKEKELYAATMMSLLQYEERQVLKKASALKGLLSKLEEKNKNQNKKLLNANLKKWLGNAKKEQLNEQIVGQEQLNEAAEKVYKMLRIFLDKNSKKRQNENIILPAPPSIMDIKGDNNVIDWNNFPSFGGNNNNNNNNNETSFGNSYDSIPTNKLSLGNFYNSISSSNLTFSNNFSVSKTGMFGLRNNNVSVKSTSNVETLENKSENNSNNNNTEIIEEVNNSENNEQLSENENNEINEDNNENNENVGRNSYWRGMGWSIIEDEIKDEENDNENSESYQRFLYQRLVKSAYEDANENFKVRKAEMKRKERNMVLNLSGRFRAVNKNSELNQNNENDNKNRDLYLSLLVDELTAD